MTYLPQQDTSQPEKKIKSKLPWLLGGLVVGALLVCGLTVLALAVILPRLASNTENAPKHGVKVIFQARAVGGEKPSAKEKQQAVVILNNRAKSYGLKSYSFEISGKDRIIALLPEEEQIEALVTFLTQTGQVEFVDMGKDCLPEGTVIITDFPSSPPSKANGQVRHTILTGEQIRSASVTTSTTGFYAVLIELDETGTTNLYEHSKSNPGKCLAITLDKRILTDPMINSAIPDGIAVIEGEFSNETANKLAIFMQYEALPLELEVIETSDY